jgi:hypothetical protein
MKRNTWQSLLTSPRTGALQETKEDAVADTAVMVFTPGEQSLGGRTSFGRVNAG